MAMEEIKRMYLNEFDIYCCRRLKEEYLKRHLNESEEEKGGE